MLTSMPTKPETWTCSPPFTPWLYNGELGPLGVLMTSACGQGCPQSGSPSRTGQTTIEAECDRKRSVAIAQSPPYHGGALCSQSRLFKPRIGDKPEAGDRSWGQVEGPSSEMHVDDRGNKKGHLLAFCEAL